MPQFDIYTFSSQLFWLTIIFSFLYFIISKFIAPKAELILSARNRCIEENINYSQEYNDKVKVLTSLKNERLSEVNAKVEDMQSQSLTLLENSFNKKKEDLKSFINNETNNANEAIDQYVDEFHTNEPESCIKLASFIIEKITNKPADLKLLKKISGKTK